MDEHLDDAKLPDNGESQDKDDTQTELMLEWHRAVRLLARLQMQGERLRRPSGPDPLRPPMPPFAPGFGGPPEAFFAPGPGRLSGQGRLLDQLAQTDGMLIKDIVMSLDIRPSSASELVAKLERQGLVRVESSSEDKRARQVFLTDEGKALSSRYRSALAGQADDLLGPLSAEEQAQLLALLQKLNAGLAEKGKEQPQGFDRERPRPGQGRPGTGHRHERGGGEHGHRGLRIRIRGP